MRSESRPRALLLSICALLLPAWVRAQSKEPSSSASTISGPVAPSEQQEVRDELKALRVEVERLRAEVEQQKKTTRSDNHPNNSGGMGLAPQTPGANSPPLTWA